MTGSPKNIDAITLFVEDLERSKLFYQDVFGLSVFWLIVNAQSFIGSGGKKQLVVSAQ